MLNLPKDTLAHLKAQLAAMIKPEDAKPLSDEALLQKLAEFNIFLDRESMGELIKKHSYVDDIVDTWEIPAHKQGDPEEDWIWISVRELWIRWFPDLPSCNLLEEKVFAGYEEAKTEDNRCRLWLEAWNVLLAIVEKTGMQSLTELDERSDDLEFPYLWLRQLSRLLWNLGHRKPVFMSKSMEICEKILELFPAENRIFLDQFRNDLAAAYILRNQKETADELFRSWLAEDPQWGHGWLLWSELYSRRAQHERDIDRAEMLLRQGLQVAGVRSKQDLLGALAAVVKEQGRLEEAQQLANEWKMLMKTTPDLSDDDEETGLQFFLAELHNEMNEVVKASLNSNMRPIGRKEPCPCGSGKKYKRCCGA